MQTYQKITEVVGTPGQMVGGMVVPNFGGKSTLKIVGDIIHEKVKLGSERRESFTKIDTINSVGVYESSIGVILIFAAIFFALGIFFPPYGEAFGGFHLFFFAMSGILTLAYFILKYRYLVVSSPSGTLLLFMTKPPYAYRQFALTIMEEASEANRTEDFESHFASSTFIPGLHTQPTHAQNGK